MVNQDPRKKKTSEEKKWMKTNLQQRDNGLQKLKGKTQIIDRVSLPQRFHITNTHWTESNREHVKKTHWNGIIWRYQAKATDAKQLQNN